MQHVAAVVYDCPLSPGARMSDSAYLDLVQVAIVGLDAAGRVTLINKKGCELLGRPQVQIVGVDWFDSFVPTELREEVRGVHARLMAGEVPAEEIQYHENLIIDSRGARRLVAWRNELVRDGSGRVVGTISAGEDITERRRADQELEQSLRELADIRYALDQAAIVAITDSRGVIKYANDKFCEISKYRRDELIGRDHRILNSGHHPKEFIRDLWHTIASGRVWRGEIRNRAKDGTLYWVDTTIVPRLDAAGKPDQYMAIRSDITARKRAEEELRNQEALARLGQMAAVVAHEVKNPLAGIAGAIGIIGNRLPSDSPDRQVVASILQRVDALNARVQDLLLFARPTPPRFASVPVGPLLQETADLLRRDPRFAEIRFGLSGDTPTIRADPQQLKEVLFNLLLNAAQATDGAGRIDVSVAVNGDHCRIEIRDDGPGISADVRQRMFEPFFSTKSQGTGLGLSIAKRVVEAHGGAIEVDSPEGAGARVRVALPTTADRAPALHARA